MLFHFSDTSGCRRITRFLIAGLFAIGLLFPGCYSVYNHPLKVDVTIARDTNFNHPLAVDVVAVYEHELLEQMSRTTSKDWFSFRKTAWLESLHGRGFQIFSWEWVPDQEVGRVTRNMLRKPVGILVFANYRGNDHYRAELGRLDYFGLEFEKDGYRVILFDE